VASRQGGAQLAGMAVTGSSLAARSRGKVRGAPFSLPGGRPMPDFVTLLTEDPRRAEPLFKQYSGTHDAQVATDARLELSVHATVEVEMLYGLVSAKVDNYAAAEA